MMDKSDHERIQFGVPSHKRGDFRTDRERLRVVPTRIVAILSEHESAPLDNREWCGRCWQPEIALEGAEDDGRVQSQFFAVRRKWPVTFQSNSGKDVRRREPKAGGVVQIIDLEVGWYRYQNDDKSDHSGLQHILLDTDQKPMVHPAQPEIATLRATFSGTISTLLGAYADEARVLDVVLDDRIRFEPDVKRQHYRLIVPIAFDRVLSAIGSVGG